MNDLHQEFHNACFRTELVKIEAFYDRLLKQCLAGREELELRLRWHEKFFRVKEIGTRSLTRSRQVFVQMCFDADFIKYIEDGKRGREYVRSVVERSYDVLLRSYFRGPEEAEAVEKEALYRGVSNGN